MMFLISRYSFLSMNLEFPSALQSNLVELQSYYQGQIDYASSQLAHVKALLQSSTAPTVALEPVIEKAVVKDITPPTPKQKAKPAIFSPSVPAVPVVKAPAKGKAKAKVVKTKPSDILPLRTPYLGLILLDAIAKVLKNHEGQKVNADTVVKELHGELSAELFRKAKERVTKNLSKGKIEDRWYSVPGQTGFYTISVDKLTN